MTSSHLVLHKQGDEVVIMEEEDTSREVKRLRSTLSLAMKQIEVSIASAMFIFGVGFSKIPFALGPLDVLLHQLNHLL